MLQQASDAGVSLVSDRPSDMLEERLLTLQHASEAGDSSVFDRPSDILEGRVGLGCV